MRNSQTDKLTQNMGDKYFVCIRSNPSLRAKPFVLTSVHIFPSLAPAHIFPSSWLQHSVPDYLNFCPSLVPPPLPPIPHRVLGRQLPMLNLWTQASAPTRTFRIPNTPDQPSPFYKSIESQSFTRTLKLSRGTSFSPHPQPSTHNHSAKIRRVFHNDYHSLAHHCRLERETNTSSKTAPT